MAQLQEQVRQYEQQHAQLQTAVTTQSVANDPPPDRVAELEAELRRVKGLTQPSVRFQDEESPSGHFTYKDITAASLDRSKGDEIFGHCIRVPHKVLAALCPNGMTTATQNQIGEAGLDVASLPGKYSSSSSDAADMNDALANSLGRVLDIASDRQGQREARDLNFKAERRNALDYIKTEEQLEQFRTDLEETSDEARLSSENHMRYILQGYGLEDDVIDYFISSSQFTTMIRVTLENYRALIDHVSRLSAGPGGFKLAQMDLAHYAHKLGVRRKGSFSRLEILFKVYCDLRDARRDKFIDSKLQQKKNASFAEAFHRQPAPKAIRETGEPTPAATTPACKRCNSRLHKGGMTQCPFKELPYAIARKLAIQCAPAPNFLEAAKKAADDHVKANPEGAEAPANKK